MFAEADRIAISQEGGFLQLDYAQALSENVFTSKRSQYGYQHADLMSM